MIVKVLFSLVFACVMALNQVIVIADPEIEIYTDITQNYVGPLSGAAVIVFIVSFVGVFLLLTLAEKYAKHNEEKSSITSPPEKGFKVFFFFAVVICVCWLPYLLSNIPGGVFFDNYLVYDIVYGRMAMSNQQPVLYTLIHVLLYQIVVVLLGGTMQAVVMTMTLIQYIVFACGLSWFLCWMMKRRFPNIFVIIVLLFFCLFPLFPQYAISNWKDTLFSLFLFLFAIAIAEVAIDGSVKLSEKRWILRYIVLAFLVCFFRNNGIYIVIVSTVLLLIVYRKEIFKMNNFIFSLSSVLLIIVTLIVQGPVFDKLGYNEAQTIESYGIPLQQVSYVILSGGDVSEEELEFIDQIISPDIRTAFSPNGFTSMKRYVGEDAKEFLNSNRGEFLRTWLSIVARNPRQAADAFFLTTIGFWNPTKGSSHAYVQTTMSDGWQWQGLTHIDLIDELTGHSIYSRLLPKIYFSGALFGWIALFCFIVVCLRKKFILLLPFVPMMTLWATVLISAPLAYSLRYVFALVVFLPLALLLAFWAKSAASAKEPGKQPDCAHPVHGDEQANLN